MQSITQINEDIYRLTMPFSDVYTTVYAIKTEDGALLFDAASYDTDADEYIIPFLNELGITSDMLKFVFISHNHDDHAGGLKALVKSFPKICVVSKSPVLKEEYKDSAFLTPRDNDTIMNVLKVVNIPGHTGDSCGIFDTRTKTLISGDCLQLYGLFGSGKWGANISLITEHMEAVDKLRSMDIQCILTAHDYHPCGYIHKGRDEVVRALDLCIEPLLKIRDLITDNPDLDDEQICELYNSDKLPTLGKHVVTAVRNTQKDG